MNYYIMDMGGIICWTNTFEKAQGLVLDWVDEYIADAGCTPPVFPSIWARVGAVRPPDEGGGCDVEIAEDVVREMAHVAGLSGLRSRGAEAALEKAVKLLDKPDVPLDTIRATHRDLHHTLGATDPFWARWLSYAKAKGIEP